MLLALAALASGQGRGPAPNREAPVTSVPFERILKANQEPQNWLTYSGSTLSQRYSALTQITPANAKDLTLASGSSNPARSTSTRSRRWWSMESCTRSRAPMT